MSVNIRHRTGVSCFENAPCNRNGKKNGYIKVMDEIWNEKGYGNLALTSQNLED